MNPQSIFKIVRFVALAFLCQGCIHDYPFATQVPSTPPGENPTIVSTYIEVAYDLSWESMIHNIDFSTKASQERKHRFVVEVRDGDKTVCQDIHYIGEEEYKSGRLRQRISQPLGCWEYEIAVWYDWQDTEENYPYSLEGLEHVALTNFTSTDAEAMRNGYACEILDLREFSNTDVTETYIKEITLQHSGARFEIVATDVNQFIAQQKDALNQGDTFTATVTILQGGYSHFNLYSEKVWQEEENLVLSGRMRLPFAVYDSLTIAQGHFFCLEEEEVTAVLTVRNSALATVSQTDYFSFPVKRGYITRIEGDFLTHPMDGIFSVNNIWEGEIEYNFQEN